LSEPFIAEIRIVAFDYPPRGWAACDGATLSIAQNQALFSLLGTTYGGDGRQNFALPNFQGRVPVHFGTAAFPLGSSGGEAAHTLQMNEMPLHNHTMQASNADGTTDTPTGAVFGKISSKLYGPATQSPIQLDPSTVATVGASQPHENMQPFLVVNIIIALLGIFPSRN
jgi:microcystin-dependent protein